jgi:TetR/AcrR family transcriptional regulator, repressor for neighboring sulfatase
MSIVKKSKPRAAHDSVPIDETRIRRVRRQPDEVRTAALESARKLLLSQGPDAITLKAVAEDLGMTHTNLIHHFGSAEGLQSTLMREMVSNLTNTMEGAVARYRSGAGDVPEFVDIVFDAFDKSGAGRLIAWLMVSGNAKLFAPVGEVVRTFIAHIEAGAHVDAAHAADLHRRFTTSMLFMVITAFGDAIIGDEMCRMLGRERDAVRDIARNFLPQLSPLVQERQKQS